MTQTRRRQELWECIHDCQWATNRTDPQWWLSITLDVPLHILYLRGIALDYFEPFINEPDPYQDMNFLEDWDAFVQKLSNIFGSYLSEDNDEDAIVAIPFLPDGKAVTYFIQFAKYQNRIQWDDRSLWKVVKDTILARISKELCFSKEDLSTFEEYKWAVLKIDNDHWKRVQEEKNRQRLAHTLQDHL